MLKTDRVEVQLHTYKILAMFKESFSLIMNKFFLILIFLTIHSIFESTIVFADDTNPDMVNVQTKYLKVEFSIQKGSFSIISLGNDGKELFRNEAPGLSINKIHQENYKLISTNPTELENQSGKIKFEILDENSISVEWIPVSEGLQEFNLHLKSTDDTKYYGTGERFNSLNQRGYIIPNKNDDRFGNKGVGSHKPIPFFMSNKGFGIWVDSYSPGVFDLCGTERFETRIQFSDTKFRVVIIGGINLKEILKDFTKLTGRPSLPPPWTFGLWKSRDVHHNQDSVFTDIEKLRKYKIPASVLVIDSPWETGYNNFKVNTQQFENPESMFNRIKKLGFNLGLWLTPFINKENVLDMDGITDESDNFSEASVKGYLVKDKNGNTALSDWWKGKGGLVDFTNPAAVLWWYNQMKKMLPYGVKAFKCDDGEGNFVSGSVFYDGTSAYKMKNRYSVLYDSVMQNFVNQYLDDDGILITRSGYTSFQRYPFAWAGDNHADFSFEDGLPSVIIAGQNAAMSGISLWGSDIAGYAGEQTKELFIRWTQFAVFCPFMQIHMTSNLGPWDFGNDALKIFRKYAVLRMQLFPYLYDAVLEAVNYGLSVIRPMALAFENDNEAAKNIYQFMCEDDLLVAPVYKEGNHRSVYLPDGKWIDYWDGNKLQGKQYIEVEAPLEKIPLFVKAGSIIPMLPDDIQTLVERNPEIDDSIKTIDDRRILQVWGGSNSQLKTYDGISASVTVVENKIQFTVSSEKERPLSIEIMYRNLSGLKIDNAEVYYDDKSQKTVISFSSLTDKTVIEWSEN